MSTTRRCPADWTTVREMVEKGDVEKIQVVNRDQAQVFLEEGGRRTVPQGYGGQTFPSGCPKRACSSPFTIGSVDSFREDLKNAEQQSGQTVPVVYENKTNDWTNVLINLLPWVLIIGVWIFIMRSMSRGAGGGAGGGIMNVGKAKAQVFDKDASKRVTFKDVAGLEEAKVEIMEIVDFLKKSEKYKELGAKIPQGCPAGRPSGNGQDAAGQSRGRRSQRAVPFDFGFRFRGDVRGRGRIACPRPVRAGQAEGSLHRLHRRDRRHRPRPRQERRIFGQRRTRKYAEPAPHGDGRLPDQYGRYRPRGDEPRRHSRQGADARRAFRPSDRGGPARRQGARGDFQRPSASAETRSAARP